MTPKRSIKEFAKRCVKHTGSHEFIRSAGSAFADAALAPVYSHKGRNMERFVLFIGYHRAGSTFLGSLLNAHPEVVISNEAFKCARALMAAATVRTVGKGRIVRRILKHDRLVRDLGYRGMGGYSFAVNTQWQGDYSRLRIVGDKNSVVGTVCLYHWPWVLDALRRQMGVPVSAFFTYRNPYDMMAAQYLRTLRNKGGNVAIPLSFLDFKPTDAEKPRLDQAFLASDNECFSMSDKLVEVLPMFSEDEVFQVKHEDFIASPKEHLRSACEFLGVECADAYLQACAAKAYPSPHKTRSKVRWTAEQKAQVAELIRKYPWFEGYAYED